MSIPHRTRIIPYLCIIATSILIAAAATPAQKQSTTTCLPPCSQDEQCNNNGDCIPLPERSPATKRTNGKGAATTRLRKHGVTVEIAWNGLVGVGPLYTFRPTRNIALDAGFGLSSMGLKYGIRSRYRFKQGNASPFIGFGLMSTSGSDGIELEIKPETSSATIVTYDLKPISFLQIAGGLDLIATKGFTLLLAGGWAIPLNNGLQNVAYDGYAKSQYPSSFFYNPDAVDLFETTANILYKGGLVISCGLGISI